MGFFGQILVHGSEESTETLREFCVESGGMTGEVFAPCVGEVVNVSAATDIYQVCLSWFSLLRNVFSSHALPNVYALQHSQQIRLTDPLVTSLHFTHPPNSEYSLAYLSGVITHPPTPTSLPTLDIPPGGSDAIPFHSPLLVGDIKLSSFRQVLQGEGLKTEFVGGVFGC